MIKNILNTFKYLMILNYEIMAEMFKDAFNPKETTSTLTKWFARVTIFVGVLAITAIILAM